MVFVACHPGLPLESRVALALRTLCGFDTRAIARALLVEPATVEKRLVRARQRLRELGVTPELPPPAGLGERLDAVMAVIYVLFSGGYSAHGGDRAIREELCAEAIRLASALVVSPLTETPKGHALLALLLLQASRLPARVDAQGRLRSLAEQDRSRWTHSLVARGLAELDRSAAGDAVSELHLEAGIAACHAVAPTFEATDWPRIVAFYDRLLALDPSPVIRVNRAIAVGHADGPASGLRALKQLEDEPRLRSSPLLAAATADLRARAGETDRARRAYERAIDLAANDDERQFLLRRLAELA